MCCYGDYSHTDVTLFRNIFHRKPDCAALCLSSVAALLWGFSAALPDWTVTVCGFIPNRLLKIMISDSDCIVLTLAELQTESLYRIGRL